MREWSTVQVEDFLESSAWRFPDKIALVCGARRLSYRQVESQCNRMANALLAQGLQRWDRVAVYLDNSVEAVLAVFAILKADFLRSLRNLLNRAPD